MPLTVREVEHLVPNWWCCLGDLCGALFLEEVSPSQGVECENKSHATFSLSPLLSAYDSRGEFAARCFCCPAAILCDAVYSDSLDP